MGLAIICKCIWVQKLYKLAAVYRVVNVSLPLTARRNGTLYAFVILSPPSSSLLSNHAHAVRASCLLTTYAVPQAQTFSLITDNVSTDPGQLVHNTLWITSTVISQSGRYCFRFVCPSVCLSGTLFVAFCAADSSQGFLTIRNEANYNIKTLYK